MSCTTVTNSADCRQVIKTSGWCFNCLRRSHVFQTCKSTSRCQKCKKHRTSICDAGSDLPAPPSRPVLNPVAPPFQTSNTLCSASVHTVLLQTARAMIHHPSNPNNSLKVRLILDGGSQKSYFSKQAQRLLKLKPNQEQPLLIATFGSGKGRLKVCPVVNVGMCLRGYPHMSLTLYVMPTTCEPLVGQPISACAGEYPHLSGLELADSSRNSSTLPIDALIGSDYYWQLVMGSICRGTSGPVAIHTKFS